jgi:hypothetical protein
MQPEELTMMPKDAQDDAWRAQGMAVGSARSMRAAMDESLRLSEQREPIEEITADADSDLLGIGVAKEGILGKGGPKEGKPRGSVVSRSAQMIVQRSEPIDVDESEANVDKPEVAVAPEVAQEEIQAREQVGHEGIGEAHNGGDANVIDAAPLNSEAPTYGSIEPAPVTAPAQEPNVSELRAADELADELAMDVVCLIAAVVLGLLLVGCALKEAGLCFGAIWRSLRGSMSDKCRTL